MDERKIQELIGDEYKDWKVKCSHSWSDPEEIALITIKKKGCRKYLWYNTNEERIVSNIVDGRYLLLNKDINNYDSSFIYSCNINGKVRAFAGLMNVYVGLVYSIGYDLVREKPIIFPINENGLIDDDKMKGLLKEEAVIGFDPEKYQNALSYDQYYYILNLLKNSKNNYTEIGDMVRNSLIFHNKEEIDKVGNMIENKWQKQIAIVR